MSKKILEVDGEGMRDERQSTSGSFYSTHKREDIEKWLSHKDADSSVCEFDEVFQTEGEWWEYDTDDDLVNCDISYNASEDADEGDCIHDEEIQEFLDEEPQRNRDEGIRSINYQFTDLMGNVQGMKDTALQLLNDFKKVVKTDDVEKLPEEEQKIYQTLKSLINP